MDNFIQNLVNDLKKSGMNVTVIEGTGDPTPVLSRLLEVFSDEEYDPNNPDCVNLCPNREVCKMVSEYRKKKREMKEMTAKQKEGKQHTAREIFKDLYGEFAEAGDWLGDILSTLVKKNADYGDTFRRLTRRDAHYPTNQMLTKIYRIENLLADEKKDANFESIEDSLADLIGYALLTYKAIKDGDLK